MTNPSDQMGQSPGSDPATEIQRAVDEAGKRVAETMASLTADMQRAVLSAVSQESRRSELALSADDEETVGSALTSEELAAERRREELEAQALPAVRQVAEKWAGTAALLFTALGFAALIQGRRQIQGLASGFEEVAAGFLLVAFALALCSIVVAALAAQGTSPARALDRTLGDLLTFERDQLRSAERLMLLSRWLAGAAVILVLAGISLLFYAPSDAEGDGPRVLAVTESGSLICGTLTEQTPSRTLRIDPGGSAPAQTVDARKAITVTAVPSCPGPEAP